MSIVYSKSKDGVLNVAVCGKISREPEIKTNTKGDKVRFSVYYAKKSYMDCDAWADSDAGHMAMCLEEGDTVMVMGTHRSWTYNDKEYQSVAVDGIFPMSIPSASSEATAEAPASRPPQNTDGYEELSDDEGLPF